MTAVRPEGVRVPTLRGNKDFRRLWLGAGLSFMGSQVSACAYPLVVLWSGGSAVVAGLVASVAQLPYLLVQLPAGVLADRVDRRRLMVVCDVGRLVVIGTVPASFLLYGILPWYLALVGFVEGAFTVAYRIAERTALPSLVEPELLLPATARNEARERAAGLLGQPAAGALMWLSAWSPFVFTALSHLAALGTLLRIKGRLQEERVVAPRRVFAELAEAGVWMWRQHFARAAVGLIAASNLLFQILVLAVLVIVKAGGGTTLTATLVTSAAGVGGVLGALSGPRWVERVSLARMVVGANLAWTLLVPVLAFSDEPVVLGLVFGLAAYVGAVWTVGISGHLLVIVPMEMRGRIAGIATLIAYGPLAFGSALGGVALERFGVAGTVIAVAGAMALLTLLAALGKGIRSVDRAVAP
ncbi:MFS transporter [Actinosynnema sp. NPDC020468]|uniref:MFS transporter n=1 Tax=Actinosynnema sp. NPDC020468 TaxID=3154488 RepID=UPI0033F268C3